MDRVGRIQKFKARLAQKQAKPKKAKAPRLAPLARGKQAKGNARITTKPIRPIDKTQGKQTQGKKS